MAKISLLEAALPPFVRERAPAPLQGCQDWASAMGGKADQRAKSSNGAAERRTRLTNDRHKFHRPCATSSSHATHQPPLH